MVVSGSHSGHALVDVVSGSYSVQALADGVDLLLELVVVVGEDQSPTRTLLVCVRKSHHFTGTGVSGVRQCQASHPKHVHSLRPEVGFKHSGLPRHRCQD